MTRRIVRTLTLAGGQQAPVERVSESTETFYEAMAPEGYCWEDSDGSLLWGLSAGTLADAIRRARAATPLACSDDACLETQADEILEANRATPLKVLQRLQAEPDREKAHAEGLKVLCALLVRAGYEEEVKAFAGLPGL